MLLSKQLNMHTTAAKRLKLLSRVSIWNEKSRGTRLSIPVLFYTKRRIKLSYFLFKCKVNIFIFIQRTRQTGTLETYWNNLLTFFFLGGGAAGGELHYDILVAGTKWEASVSAGVQFTWLLRGQVWKENTLFYCQFLHCYATAGKRTLKQSTLASFIIKRV